MRTIPARPPHFGVERHYKPRARRITGPVGTPVAWYDAALVSSITTVSDAVSQWDDRMGSFNLTEATAADRPLYGGAGARQINGITVVEFVSTDELSSGAPRDDLTSTSFVLAQADSTGTRTMLGCNTGSGNQFRQLSGQISTSSEGTATIGSHNAVHVINVPYIGVQVLTATTLEHWMLQSGLGFSRSSVSHSTTFSTPRTLRMGVRATGAEPWDGLIGEVILYDRTLTDTEIRRNLVYLASKWGLLAP